jgi:hypothetical protein
MQDLSEERAARNEVAFRDANEQIDARRRELELGGSTPYICECEDAACTELVRLTNAQYSEIRSGARRFLIARGHSTSGRVVSEHSDYDVVEKDGRAGEIAESEA